MSQNEGLELAGWIPGWNLLHRGYTVLIEGDSRCEPNGHMTNDAFTQILIILKGRSRRAGDQIDINGGNPPGSMGLRLPTSAFHHPVLTYVTG